MALTLAGAAVRLPGIFNDFSLDEIWSLNLAQEAGSVAKVFSSIHHDNNHWLNSIYLLALGERRNWWTYRLLALACGTASVALAGLVAGKHFGRSAGLIAAILTGVSYLLVHYSSEARGYAPMICFALLALWLIDREGWRFVPLFWLAAILAFLSHQAFALVYAGCGVWSLWQMRRGTRTLAKQVALHIVPIVFAVWLYLFDIRGQTVGGASSQSLAEALRDVFIWTCGRPLPMLSAAAASILCLAGLAILMRRHDDGWIMLLVSIILAPAALLLSPWRPQYVGARLFQAQAALALVAIAGALGALWDWKNLGARIAVAIMVLAFIAGNAAHLAHFYRDGRGHFFAAIQYISQRSPRTQVPITADHRWRTEMLLSFYGKLLPDGQRFTYVERENWPTTPPLWILRQDDDIEPKELPSNMRMRSTFQFFERVRDFPCYGPTGWRWYVYQYQPER